MLFPHVIVSASTGQTIADLIKGDQDLPHVERAYKERLAAAQRLIAAADPNSVPWPPISRAQPPTVIFWTVQNLKLHSISPAWPSPSHSFMNFVM